MNNEFTISTTGAILASILTYPIDADKTNYQVAIYNKNPLGAPSIIKHMWHKNGINSFYKGVSGSLITYPLFWGTFFQTKDLIKPNSNYKMLNTATSSFVASGFASLLTNPLFVLKTRFQSAVFNSDPQKIDYIYLLKNISKKEGMMSWFKGYGSTLTNNTKLCIQFPLYDEIYDKTKSITTASMISKIISTSIYYPSDLIRTNQRNMKNNINMWDAAKNIFQNNGIKGFYKGCLIYNMISVPNFIIIMVVRDYLTKK